MRKNRQIEDQIQQIKQHVTQGEAQIQSPELALYEQQSLERARHGIRQLEHLSPPELRANQAEFLGHMQHEPWIVARRINSILEGIYGYGKMMLARSALHSRTMDRKAKLIHLVGELEWRCPQKMAIAAWKKLTKPQQAALDRAVEHVIKQALETEALDPTGT